MKTTSLMLAMALATATLTVQAAESQPKRPAQVLQFERVSVGGQEISLATTREVFGERVQICRQ
jgi:hypothetical protein